MKKLLTKICALTFAVAFVLALATPAFETKAQEGAEVGYTYTFDYWGDVQYSPDAYSVTKVFTSVDIGLDVVELPMETSEEEGDNSKSVAQNISGPRGLTVSGDMVYICDTGNNRIIQCQRTGSAELTFVRTITGYDDGESRKSFKGPTDVAVSKQGNIFIADRERNRIVKLDKDLNFLQVFVKPTHETFDQAAAFLPYKIVVDSSERVYCLASQVTKGLMKYEADGTFSGFIGANPVNYSFYQYIWKRIASVEQLEKMEDFVPTEYDNVYMDHEGFMYVTTSHVSEAGLKDGSENAIRLLNLMGSDILIRNGNYYPYGDIHMGSAGGYSGTSLLVDITALENGSYFALDRNRGRVFAYDDQGRLLFAFGGSGNMDGCFRYPVAIDNMTYNDKHDILVLDQFTNSVTLMTPTEYGNAIFKAIEEFQDGQYEASCESWKQVIDLNGNYDLAYIGVGRTLLREEKYKEAMEYFELKYDRENYSRAYVQYRKEWCEEHIVAIILVIILLIATPLIIGRIKKVKWEIDTNDYLQRLEKKNKLDNK